MGLTHLTSAGITDVGARRKNNEDSIVLLPEYGVFCVADGMGGAQGGEIASDRVVTQLAETFHSLKSPTAVSSVNGRSRLIVKSLNAASQWVKKRSDKMGISGSGSTAVVIAFDDRDPTKAMILHAGDSRAYRLRDGTLEQISLDHTVAAAAGVTDDTELPPMFRGVVTRAVGVKARVEVEKTPVEVRPGDVYLLASDGLDKMVKDERIQEMLLSRPVSELQESTQALIDEANGNGGVDNVSVILVAVGDWQADAAAEYSSDEQAAEAAILATVAGEEIDSDSAGANTPTPGTSEDLSDEYTPDADTLEGSTPSRNSGGAPTSERIRGTGAAGGSWWQKILRLPLAVRIGVPAAVVVLALVPVFLPEPEEPDELAVFDEVIPRTETSDVESVEEAGDRILAIVGEDEEPDAAPSDTTAEKRAAEEAARAEAEAARVAAEQARIEAETQAAEEAARLEAERAAETARLAAEQARIKAEAEAEAEAARLAEEQKAAEEQARIEAEAQAADEAARVEAEAQAAKEAARVEAERKAEAERLAAQQKAAAEQARMEAEAQAAEDAARVEAERTAEAERLAAQQKAAEEKARMEEEQARIEAEAQAADEAARVEAEAQAAKEAARVEAERKAEAERLAAQQKAAEEKARMEAEAQAAEEAARVEAERRAEAERLAAQQKAAEEKARMEAEAQAAEEAARVEAERKAEAERLAAQQKAAEEKARMEAEAQAAEEAARVEAERKAEAERLAAQQKAAEEQARMEAEAQAAEEAARLAEEREKSERAAKLDKIQDQFTAQVEAARTSGNWGSLRQQVSRWEGVVPGLVTDSDVGSSYREWVGVWEDAKETPGQQLGQRYQASGKLMGEVSIRCGLIAPDIETLSFSGSADEVAATYCAATARLQRDFIGQLQQFVEAHQAQADALGDDPDRTLKALWKFARLSNTEAILKLSEEAERTRRGLEPLARFVKSAAGRPLSDAQISKIPVDGMASVAEAGDVVWREIYKIVDLLAPQVSVWRNWDDDRIAPLLDEIAALQQESVLGRATYGEDFRAWRLSQDHAAMEELLVNVAEVYPLLQAKLDAANR